MDQILIIYKYFNQLSKKNQIKLNSATCDYLRRQISVKLVLPIIYTEQELLHISEDDLNRRISRRNIFKELENDILEICVRLLERKKTKQLEDIINDDVTDHLRTKKYVVTDQTRSGSSKNGKDAGRLDIMIRDSRNLPLTIIEAFRLSSVGERNNIISEHLFKLVTKYDTSKLNTKYILIYSGSKNFIDLCDNYLNYLIQLKKNEKYKIDSVGKITKPYGDDISSLRAIDTFHRINGVFANIKHILIDFN